jgi:hypothetical protein
MVEATGHVPESAADVLSAHDLQSLQPQLVAWLERVKPTPVCALQQPATTPSTPIDAVVTDSTSSKSLLEPTSLAPAEHCACMEHCNIIQRWEFQQPVSDIEVAANGKVTKVPSTSSQAPSFEDPSTVAATVGSAAQELMSLALEVVQGGHSLKALEFITRCFEK